MYSLKQKAITLIENKMGKTARVLDVRRWEPEGLVEIDLHLPETNMYKWTTVQHMKCKVAPGQYRDYSPAGWDADTHTCTLYISTLHPGAGSTWAGGLQRGDEVLYLGVGNTSHSPVAGSKLVCLGDETAIGHFWALQQLADACAAKVCGAIAVSDPAYSWQLQQYLPMNLQPLVKTDAGGEAVLAEWVEKELKTGDAVVYLAGHIPSVVALRRQLKSQGYSQAFVKAQGFWS